MAYYLFQAAYTADALAALSKKPQNRMEIIGQTLEKLGGKLVGGWFCFGDYDVVIVAELPDNVSAAAFAVAAAIVTGTALSCPDFLLFEFCGYENRRQAESTRPRIPLLNL